MSIVRVHGTYYELDPEITDEWFDEYNQRSEYANLLFDLIDKEVLTEKVFLRSDKPGHVGLNWKKILTLSMEMQISLQDKPDPGKIVRKITKAPPLVEGVDYIVETRDGMFGIWPLNR